MDEITIVSRDYWFKVVEFLQQNWALVDSVPGGACIWFVSDASSVFDELSFESTDEAHSALRHNGFARFQEDTSARQFLHAPEPPFRRRPHPSGLIYSRGRYWRSSSDSTTAGEDDAATRTVKPANSAGTNWLQAFIEDAVQRDLCTTTRCTTCGAREFRLGLLQSLAKHGESVSCALDRESAVSIGRALAGVRTTPRQTGIEDPVRLILFDVWCTLGESIAQAEVAPYLAGTWGGEILDRMRSHYQRTLAAQRLHAESQEPEIVRQRREADKLVRREPHARRLELKQDRDHKWRQSHPNAAPARHEPDASV